MLKFPWVEGKLKQIHGCVPHQRRLAKAFLWEINGTDFLGTVKDSRNSSTLTDDSSSQVVRCLRPTSANANFKDSLCLLKQRHGVIHPRIGSLSHFDTFGCLPAFNQPLKTEDTWRAKPQEWVCNP